MAISLIFPDNSVIFMCSPCSEQSVEFHSIKTGIQELNVDNYQTF